MRVIAGTHRRRVLLGPEGDEVTRPITDRVKQSLFDRLTVMGVFDGGTAVDVFAGTGSLGIESLSRGSAHCVFVERDRVALDRLQKNLATLQLADRADVVRADALRTRWFDRLAGHDVPVVFVDPPYALIRDPNTCDEIRGTLTDLAAVASPGAALVVRSETGTDPPAPEGWSTPDTHLYGKMSVHLYRRT